SIATRDCFQLAHGQATHRPGTAWKRGGPFMDGHWYGKYTGSTSGQIVVELDDRGDHFGGCAYVYDNDLSRPSTFAIVKTTDKANHIQFTAQLLPLRPSPASEGPTTASVSTSA